LVPVGGAWPWMRSVTRYSMKTARIGVGLGGISIAFSTLCFLVMPAFTAALILAMLFGVPSSAIAFGLKAKRTALVTLVFAPTPIFGFLLMENASHLVGSGYIAFLALGAAFLIAALALVDYSKARRSLANAAV
jgi:hypothetical protein